MRKKIAAGNWKMNGTAENLDEIRSLIAGLGTVLCDVVICPPATLIHRAAELAKGSPVQIGGQDCHMSENGAHTGDISAQMIHDAGGSHVIVGHSERRQTHGERSDDVRAKARAALTSGLTAIVCVGETLPQREAANTLDIVGGQLAGSIPDDVSTDNLVVAYEPIWAIGTGKIATIDQINEVHDFIRARVERRFGAEIGQTTPILYGGSVKAENAAEIFAAPNVDGGLVGGASLKSNDFLPIIRALT